jgi:hypothetical protein
LNPRDALKRLCFSLLNHKSLSSIFITYFGTQIELAKLSLLTNDLNQKEQTEFGKISLLPPLNAEKKFWLKAIRAKVVVECTFPAALRSVTKIPLLFGGLPL